MDPSLSPELPIDVSPLGKATLSSLSEGVVAARISFAGGVAVEIFLSKRLDRSLLNNMVSTPELNKWMREADKGESIGVSFPVGKETCNVTIEIKSPHPKSLEGQRWWVPVDSGRVEVRLIGEVPEVLFQEGFDRSLREDLQHAPAGASYDITSELDGRKFEFTLRVLTASTRDVRPFLRKEEAIDLSMTLPGVIFEARIFNAATGVTADDISLDGLKARTLQRMGVGQVFFHNFKTHEGKLFPGVLELVDRVRNRKEALPKAVILPEDSGIDFSRIQEPYEESMGLSEIEKVVFTVSNMPQGLTLREFDLSSEFFSPFISAKKGNEIVLPLVKGDKVHFVFFEIEQSWKEAKDKLIYKLELSGGADLSEEEKKRAKQYQAEREEKKRQEEIKRQEATRYYSPLREVEEQRHKRGPTIGF